MAKSGRTTLREIARQAGISPMSVSVVLNGARSNTRVSDATRRRITEIASELNYSPNAMAQGLKRQRTHTIGVLFGWAGTHTVHSLFSIALLDGIVAAAASSGHNVLLYTERWQNAAASSSTFSDKRTDGIILVSPLEHSDVVPTLASLGIFTTVLSSVTDVAGVPFINMDNALSVSLVLDHLCELGHKRIAYVSPDLTRFNMRDRHDAFRAGMAERHLPVGEDYVLANMSVTHREMRLESIRNLLRLPSPPTAIFAATDDLAADVLDAARKERLFVPDDLSVVGFDDVLVASLTQPKLTTVRQPLFQMGQQAVNLLIERIEEKGDSAHPTKHIVVPELVVRESTAPPPP